MRRSLLNHLLSWALGALVLVWGSFIVIGFMTGEHEADELTDGHLASIASLLVDEPVGELLGDAAPTESIKGSQLADMNGMPNLKSHDYQQSMSMVVWDVAGRVLSHRGEAPIPVFDAEQGFATVTLGEPARAWRTFSRWDAEPHERKVMVMLSVEERDDLAFDIAEQVALPGLWLLPFIALAVALAIQRGLRPLRELSRDVGALNVHQATHLKGQHPQVEFAAVVDSINTLVDRHREVQSRERQLASEFAHELRTPLAAIALHASALRGPMSDTERELSLRRLERDALHAGEVVTQLLALARASRTEMNEAAQTVDLSVLAANVVAEYSQAADESGHELALVGGERPFQIVGHAVLLELALRNLIGNALGATTRGGTVEVQLDSAGQWMQVCDTGRAADDSPAVGDAHAYTLGLGLGHRVVEKVAAVHSGSFAQIPPPEGFASCFRITFDGRSR